MKSNKYIFMSIIVPAYNANSTIQECLESILSEVNFSFEVIVIDDGSVDGTQNIVRKISKMDKRVKFIKQPNLGVSFARNNGIKHAKGEYIMFVDADDKLESAWGQHINFVNGEDVIIFSGRIDKKMTKRELMEVILGYRLSRGLISGPFSKVFNRKFLLNNDIEFNEKIINGEDMLFNIEVIIKTNSIRLVNYSFYDYRININSSTKKYDNRIIESDMEFHKDLYRLTKNIEDFEKIREYSLQMAIITIAQRLAFVKSYKEVKNKYKILMELPYVDAFNEKCMLNKKAKIIFLMLKYKRYYEVYKLLSCFNRKHLNSINNSRFVRI